MQEGEGKHVKTWLDEKQTYLSWICGLLSVWCGTSKWPFNYCLCQGSQTGNVGKPEKNSFTFSSQGKIRDFEGRLEMLKNKEKSGNLIGPIEKVASLI